MKEEREGKVWKEWIVKIVQKVKGKVRKKK